MRYLTRALQRPRHGVTWTALIVLAEEEPPDVPVVDPMRLTPEDQEEAGRLRAIIEAGGLAAFSDADLALAECLQSQLDGLVEPAVVGTAPF